MNGLRLSRHRWAIATLLSLSLVLFFSFISPLFPATRTQTEVFNQVWETVQDNFYDPKMNGVDWKSLRKSYEPQVTAAKSKAEFAAVVNQMLAELKTSHTYYYTPEEPAYYQVLGIFVPRSSQLQNPSSNFYQKEKLNTAALALSPKRLKEKPLSVQFLMVVQPRRRGYRWAIKSSVPTIVHSIPSNPLLKKQVNLSTYGSSEPLQPTASKTSKLHRKCWMRPPCS